MILFIDYNDIDNFLTKFKKTTETEVIKITPIPNTPTKITNRKFGGVFYLPKNAEIRTTNKGEQLTFLAQINCEELPKNNIYPKSGIMQFWIYGGSPDLGADFEVDYNNINSNTNKRVLYYPDVTEHYSEDEVTTLYQPKSFEEETGNTTLTPLMKGSPFGLSFELDKQSMTPSDHHFDAHFVKEWNKRFPSFKIELDWTELYIYDEELYDYIEEQFNENFSAAQIGGFPSFTQWDPRFKDEFKDYNILLLQINSYDNPECKIMWGDCGVGNFFITKKQLKKLDFSKILYTWDCY